MSRVKLKGLDRAQMAVFNALRFTSPAVCSAIGQRIGAYVGYPLSPSMSANIRSVLRAVRPDLGPAEQEAMVRRAFGNIGRTFTEFAVYQKLRARVRWVGDSICTEVAADPRPFILVYPHLANWEVLAATASTHPAIAGVRRVFAVYAQIDNPVRMAIADKCRRSLPVELLPQGPRVWKQILECLAQPNSVFVAPVDGADPVRRRFPLFGRKPDHRSAIGKLVRVAAATGARLLPVSCTRKPGARFVITVLPPIEIARGQISVAQTESYILHLNEIFEPLVRDHIDDWYMAAETEFEAP